MRTKYFKGDWDPKEVGPNSREGFPHVTEKVFKTLETKSIFSPKSVNSITQVSCVRQHPQFNSRSLAYNLAVLKLAGEPEEVI